MSAVLPLTTMTLVGAANGATRGFGRSLLAAFRPLPDEALAADHPNVPETITLGRTLYNEKRFSRDHQTACKSCHQQSALRMEN